MNPLLLLTELGIVSAAYSWVRKSREKASASEYQLAGWEMCWLPTNKGLIKPVFLSLAALAGEPSF